MDPNYLIGDEVGEEGLNQVDGEYEDRDIVYTNSEKEHSQEDTKMEVIATKETLEESAIEEDWEGVDLATIVEAWKLNWINAIPKHQPQKI